VGSVLGEAVSLCLQGYLCCCHSGLQLDKAKESYTRALALFRRFDLLTGQINCYKWLRSRHRTDLMFFFFFALS
jgi:hypothetical protein